MESIFEKVFRVCEVSSLTDAERIEYEKSLQEKWDYENDMAYAKNEGFETGKKEGLKEGAYANSFATARKILNPFNFSSLLKSEINRTSLSSIYQS